MIVYTTKSHDKKKNCENIENVAILLLSTVLHPCFRLTVSGQNVALNTLFLVFQEQQVSLESTVIENWCSRCHDNSLIPLSVIVSDLLWVLLLPTSVGKMLQNEHSRYVTSTEQGKNWPRTQPFSEDVWKLFYDQYLKETYWATKEKV